jgi:hypothetical protein
VANVARRVGGDLVAPGGGQLVQALDHSCALGGQGRGGQPLCRHGRRIARKPLPPPLEPVLQHGVELLAKPCFVFRVRPKEVGELRRRCDHDDLVSPSVCKYLPAFAMSEIKRNGVCRRLWGDFFWTGPAMG